MARTAPQARPYAAGLRRLGFLLALAAPGTAQAGAWIAAEEGRAITTLGYRQDGDVRGYETDAYLERPVNERFALVVKTYYAQDTLGNEDDEADAAVKALVWRGRRTVAAVQAGATWRSDPGPGCAETGGEARGLWGASTRSGGRFVNIDAAYRYAPGCSHARYEATYGHRAGRSWLFLGQVFADDDLKFGETLKAQASIVGFTRAGRGLQLSVRVRADAGDVIEPTIILGYWSAARE